MNTTRKGFIKTDKEYSLKIANISPVIENGQFSVELVFTDELPDNIKTGQSFLLQLDFSDSRQVLTIPNGTYFSETGGYSVFIMNKEHSMAFRREIKIGRSNREYLEVTSGLEENEEIIISSYEAYSDIDSISFLSE